MDDVKTSGTSCVGLFRAGGRLSVRRFPDKRVGGDLDSEASVERSADVLPTRHGRL